MKVRRSLYPLHLYSFYRIVPSVTCLGRIPYQTFGWRTQRSCPVPSFFPHFPEGIQLSKILRLVWFTLHIWNKPKSKIDWQFTFKTLWVSLNLYQKYVIHNVFWIINMYTQIFFYKYKNSLPMITYIPILLCYGPYTKFCEVLPFLSTFFIQFSSYKFNDLIIHWIIRRHLMTMLIDN